MAEAAEPKNALDSLLAADDADIQTLMEQQKVSEGETVIDPASAPAAEETAAEETPAEETPAEEKPPVEEPPEEKPPVEEPPPEEKPPAEQAKPEEKPPPEKPPPERQPDRNDFAWKELRRLRREQKEREALAAAKPAEAPPEVAPVDEFDPIAQAQRDAAEARKIAEDALRRADQADQNAKAQAEQRQIVEDVEKQENAFRQTHPDYDEARTFAIEARREQMEALGELDALAAWWMNPKSVFHHPNGMQVSAADIVAQHAQETGKDPENFADCKEAARDIALRIDIHQWREKLVANCRATGRNPAEAIYTVATKLGRRVETAAPVVQEKAATPSAQEKVQKAKQQAEKQKGFSQSLSAMTTNNAPLPKRISSRKELMALNAAEQDKLIAEKDIEDPTWFSNLED
jgi:hypothetical protein